ncbi:hypothetical protein BGZ73_004690 [Actinomortierella ambigua]|nr:hypothetical protein BGZ73_004690 [Actinomortierella ambigua]
MAFSRFILHAASAAGRIQITQPARTHIIYNSAAATGSGIHRLLRTQQQQPCRTFITATRPAWAADVQKGVETITDLFMIARDEVVYQKAVDRPLRDVSVGAGAVLLEDLEELEYAEEAKGTVYYNDDKEAARVAVQECLDQFNTLMGECTEEQKTDVQRKIGLKIQELKAQLDALNAEELED